LLTRISLLLTLNRPTLGNFADERGTNSLDSLWHREKFAIFARKILHTFDLFCRAKIAPHQLFRLYYSCNRIHLFTPFVNRGEQQFLATYALREHLTSLAYKEVRSIATRLGLRLRHQQQKADWITPIVTGWQSATTRHQWLAQLSVTAREAMTRLLTAEQIPAPLFWAEYGPVRQVTVNQHWTPPPWQAPATVSEELYYSGLLCPTPRSLARAQVVSLPVDLRELLKTEDRKTRRQEDRKTRRVKVLFPCLPVSLSSCLPLAGRSVTMWGNCSSTCQPKPGGGCCRGAGSHGRSVLP
jgi:hypothetical protein